MFPKIGMSKEDLKMKFKVGDRVKLQERHKLTYPHWKNQEVGVGVIYEIEAPWFRVKWEDGSKNAYHLADLVLAREKASDRLTIKEVLNYLQAHKMYQSRELWTSNAHTLPIGVDSIKSNIKYIAIISEPYGCELPKGKQMFGAALYEDGHAEMQYFKGGECPWFVYKEPQWPEGYEEYGVFGWKGRTYVHKDFKSSMEEECWSPWPDNHSLEKGYYNYGGSSFEEFIECVPPYVKTKNFDL